jgi:hypothetical protein
MMMMRSSDCSRMEGSSKRGNEGDDGILMASFSLRIVMIP